MARGESAVGGHRRGLELFQELRVNPGCAQLRRGHAYPSRTTVLHVGAHPNSSFVAGLSLAAMVSGPSSKSPGRNCVRGNDDPKRSPGGAAEPGEAEAGQYGPPRILIVEDEWFIAIESEAVLREAGFDVVGIAVTAEEAVTMAERHEPDLVLMDIRLRGARDGIDAAREIRRRFDIPCLFATAHSEQGVRDHAQSAAPAGWLTKPFSDRQLVTAVKGALTA